MDELPDQVRRRLDEVFGEVVPAVPADERDDRPGTGDDDVELLANRPPHHEGHG